MSATADAERFARAVEAGAEGLMHKLARIREVIGAARHLAAVEHLLSSVEITEVLRTLAEGLRDPEIAARLYVSPGTVRTHMANILAKLEAGSRLEALVLAATHGGVRIGRPSHLPDPRDPNY